jgi:hypothetical protein
VGLYLPGNELFVDFGVCAPMGDERQRLIERLHLLRSDDLSCSTGVFAAYG